jgi:hypothetical protein
MGCSGKDAVRGISFGRGPWSQHCPGVHPAPAQGGRERGEGGKVGGREAREETGRVSEWAREGGKERAGGRRRGGVRSQLTPRRKQSTTTIDHERYFGGVCPQSSCHKKPPRYLSYHQDTTKISRANFISLLLPTPHRPSTPNHHSLARCPPYVPLRILGDVLQET